jgi:hypothetical protein
MLQAGDRPRERDTKDAEAHIGHTKDAEAHIGHTKDGTIGCLHAS